MNELIAGRYRLLERIGSGGMADVWQAEDVRSGDVVAVKRLHAHLAADGVARSRFRREIDAATAVHHPSAVRVLDSGDDGDGAWLVMEYVGGGSVADRLGSGPFDQTEAALIVADVADVLATLHAAGMVHRDVTPSNILLTTEGGARLADFGIARAADGGMDDVTATGDVVGTMRFLAPEVLAGSPATPASDVWSLGAVLYEMIAGRSPFDPSSPAALIASQDGPLARIDGVRDELQALLRDMLQPAAAARPAAATVAATLRRAAGVPLTDPDATVVIPLARSAHVGAPAPIVASPSAGDDGDVVRSRDVSVPSTVGGARRGPIVAAAAALLLVAAVALAAALPGPEAGDAEVAPPSPAQVTPTPESDPTATPAQAAPANEGGADRSKGGGQDKDKGKGKGKGKGKSD